MTFIVTPAIITRKRCHAGFDRNSSGFGRRLHLLLVHTLVDHACDLDITSEREPSDTVFGVAALPLEEREPRIKEYVELFDADLEYARHDEVSELVNRHQKRQTHEELDDLDKYFHR